MLHLSGINTIRKQKERLNHFCAWVCTHTFTSSNSFFPVTHRFTSALLYFWPSPGSPKLITSLIVLDGWCLNDYTSFDCCFPQFPSSITLCVDNALYWKVGENMLYEEKHLNLHSECECSLSTRKWEEITISFIEALLLTALAPKLCFSIPTSKFLPLHQPDNTRHFYSQGNIPWLSAVHFSSSMLYIRKSLCRKYQL